MTYIVNRQSPWMGEECIEIANGVDEISPGMLTSKYPSEGEYSTRQEALDAALELQKAILAATKVQWPIVLSYGASIGLYSDGAEGLDLEELQAWVSREEPTDDEIYNGVGVEGGIAYDTTADEPGSLGENDWRL